MSDSKCVECGIEKISDEKLKRCSRCRYWYVCLNQQGKDKKVIINIHWLRQKDDDIWILGRESNKVYCQNNNFKEYIVIKNLTESQRKYYNVIVKSDLVDSKNSKYKGNEPELCLIRANLYQGLYDFYGEPYLCEFFDQIIICLLDNDDIIPSELNLLIQMGKNTIVNTNDKKKKGNIMELEGISWPEENFRNMIKKLI